MANASLRVFGPKSLGMLLTILALVLVVEIGLPVLLFLMRDRMMFFPSTHPGPEAGLQLVRGASDIQLLQIPRPDGRLLATYDACPKSNWAAEGPLIIFFHGNAGNIGSRAQLIEEFVRQTGIRTVLLDYSGYGGNEGTPGEHEVYRDGLAVYDYFRDQGVPAGRIVLYGESLGGAVALAVASKRPCAGLLLQSTFASVSSMARRLYPWLPLSALLTRNLFPSVDRISQLEIPILIAHGKKDRIIPISEGRKLHRAAPPQAEFLAIEAAGHNNFFEVAGADYFSLIADRVQTWTAHAQEEPHVPAP